MAPDTVSPIMIDRDLAVLDLMDAIGSAPAFAIRAAARLLRAIAPTKRRRSLIALPSHSDFYGEGAAKTWRNCPCPACADTNPLPVGQFGAGGIAARVEG